MKKLGAQWFNNTFTAASHQHLHLICNYHPFAPLDMSLPTVIVAASNNLSSDVTKPPMWHINIPVFSLKAMMDTENAFGGRATGRPLSRPSRHHLDSRCQCIEGVFHLFLACICSARAHPHAKHLGSRRASDMYSHHRWELNCSSFACESRTSLRVHAVDDSWPADTNSMPSADVVHFGPTNTHVHVCDYHELSTK